MAFTPAIVLGLSAVGALASGAGAIAGGIGAKNAANYQAAVAKNNQITAEQNAKHAEAAGEAQAAATSLKSAAAGGKLKAAQAANNIDVNSGSAVDVQESQREQGALDSETILSNAELAAYGYRVQGTGFGAQAQLDKLSGQNAEIGGYLKGAGGLLSSASSIGGKWGGPADGGWSGDSGHSAWVDNPDA